MYPCRSLAFDRSQASSAIILNFPVSDVTYVRASVRLAKATEECVEDHADERLEAPKEKTTSTGAGDC